MLCPKEVSATLPRSSPRSCPFLCCVHPRSNARLVPGATALWLCCPLGRWLSWGAALPMLSQDQLPQIWLQTVVWGGQKQSIPTGQGTAVYSSPRAVHLRYGSVKPPGVHANKVLCCWTCPHYASADHGLEWWTHILLYGLVTCNVHWQWAPRLSLAHMPRPPGWLHAAGLSPLPRPGSPRFSA